MPSPEPHRDSSAQHQRVLITGGAGFIGSHLTELLVAHGDHVSVIDNLSTGSMQNLRAVVDSIEFIHADVSEGLGTFADSARFDRVYHLAAAVGVELVLRDPIGSIRSNVLETDAVLEFALNHGKAPTLIASSSEVYGKPGTSVFSEDDDLLLGPTTITRWSYAHAKAIDEHLSLAYHQQHGLTTVACRFFNTVGPRQIGRYGMVLPRFVKAAMENEPLRVFGDGTQTRCFCDGRDVARALPELLDSPACAGGVINLGNDHPISIHDLARRVIETLGSESTIELVPYSDAYPAGFEDLRHRKPDLDKVRSAIGFTPRYTLEQTVLDLRDSLIAKEPAQGDCRSC